VDKILQFRITTLTETLSQKSLENSDMRSVSAVSDIGSPQDTTLFDQEGFVGFWLFRAMIN